MNYSCLRETRQIRDVSDLSGQTLAATPATLRIHAVRTVDDQVICPYTRKDADIAEPGRDWTTVLPGEVPCDACAGAIQLAEREVAR